MLPRTLAALLIALTAIGGLAGCGESKEDKAKAKVCDARDGIASEIDKLQGLTLTTATVSQVTASVNAIGDDLKTIADAQSDLSDERRKQIQEANAEFGATVQEIASQIAKTISLQQAAAQFEAAVQKVASSYKSSLAEFDCD